MPEPADAVDAGGIPALVDDLHRLGVRRLHVLAWRDLDDPDAGGSERHLDELLSRWAVAGLTIAQRTSAAAGRPPIDRRHGYDVTRRGSRYSVFPRAAAAELLRGGSDALVEVWNGVPWFSPIWYRRPHITVLHHVHGPMWDQLLPGPLAAAGRFLEARAAPPWYRHTHVVTPSAATRDELLALGFRRALVTPVDNGTDPFFSPGGTRWPVPTVLGVGRLAPVKRFGLLLDVVLATRRRIPDVQLRIVGEGPLRAELDAWIAAHDASGWVHLLGHVSAEQLRDEYRRAWVVGSASLAEGWGLSLTEGAACGTPAVATDISGHRCSVVDGETGVLAPPERLADAATALLGDDRLRRELGAAARARAAERTWDATATGVLEVLRRAVAERRAARGARTRLGRVR